MNTLALQSEREIDAFTRFASVAAIPIDPQSIEKRNPPEPDILCCHLHDGPIAFELVELLDENFAGRLGRQLNSVSALEAFYDQLPVDERIAFDVRFGNAAIFIDLQDGITHKRLQANCNELFRELAATEPNFAGVLVEFTSKVVRKLVKAIEISRSDFRGPAFTITNIGGVGNPVIDSIQTKLRNSYRSIHPQELLAYFDWRNLLPENFWKSAAERFLNALPNTEPFRRIWIVDLKIGKVECVCTHLDNSTC